jgi:hypothetical protein
MKIIWNEQVVARLNAISLHSLADTDCNHYKPRSDDGYRSAVRAQ